MIEEKITLPEPMNEDKDEQLRPLHLTDFVGQEELKENLFVFIKAAKIRRLPLDHTLLYGPPGLGKTTLAGIIANEMGAEIRITSAPALEKQGDLMAILTGLNEGDVLFIDEIHRLKRILEEILYPALEDFKVDLMIGEGTGAKTLRISLPKFTLVGATTHSGSLSGPLRTRFGIIEHLDFYQPKELKQIIIRSAKILSINIEPDGALEIAGRSRGTPRIANRLLKRVSDYALVEGKVSINREFANYALSRLNIDSRGLDRMDVRLLETMIDHYNGGPVGLSAMAAALSEDTETIEDMYEPYLIQCGFIKRTQRGRIVSDAAYTHLGRVASKQEPNLFE